MTVTQFNDTFLRACKREPVEYTPVWYMRQAGRYDPDYRKIKEKYSLLEICEQPELAAEVTLMPVHKLGVDAAILYSDIMNPVASLGVEFDIVKNIGPVIEEPIRTLQQIESLRPIDVAGDLSHIMETIRILDKELKVPLISFYWSAVYDRELLDRRATLQDIYAHESNDVQRAGYVV